MRSTNNGATWNTPVSLGRIVSRAMCKLASKLSLRMGEFSQCGNASAVCRRSVAHRAIGIQPLDDRASLDGTKAPTREQDSISDTGIIRDHHQVCIVPSGGLHVAWAHGPPGELRRRWDTSFHPITALPGAILKSRLMASGQPSLWSRGR